MSHIALITYKKSPKLTKSDTYLEAAFLQHGYKVTALPWDTPHTSWDIYDALILRSPWDYHLRYTEFCDWLHSLSKQHISVWNPMETLQWNSNKHYIVDLEKKGVPVIPTLIYHKDTGLNLYEIQHRGWKDIIIKPTIGASSYGVTKTHLSKLEKQDIFTSSNEIMVQPFIPEVSTGEYSCVFFNRVLSHTILKKPQKGDYRVNRSFRPDETVVSLPQEHIATAQQILDAVNGPLLYARVDGVIIEGKFTLMELELVEPHLFFDLYPPAAQTCVQAYKTLSKNP